MARAQAAAADAGTDAIRRLLGRATQDAFARLSASQGFWNSRVARFPLPILFRKTPAVAGTPLANDAFRFDLEYKLNIFAEAGARGAEAGVQDAARKLAVADPAAILHGRITSATSALRLETGVGLVNAMIPPLQQTLAAQNDPTVTQAVALLAGVTLRDVAHAVALVADNGIWYEIGAAEARIRANPQATGDAALVAALRGA
ncbi:MAG: DUF4197 family protein [Novosphingobium sp.]|nr:DUF4197 family protein [Novosphingobium sp.]